MRVRSRAVALGSAKLLTRAEVTFLGVAEGVLFYEVHRVGCGVLELDVSPVVKGGVSRRFPALTTQESGVA